MKKTIIILLFTASCFAVSPSITSFNSGQVSPLMESRVDYAKYASCSRMIENMLVVPQGPVTKRPGTKYIYEVYDSDFISKIRLIPFEYSTDDSYVLALGDESMKFYRNGGRILISDTDANGYKITTPYTASDLFNIQYAQSDNYMYMVDGSHEPQKLSRTGHASWTIEDCNFTTGPFLPENITATTITPEPNASYVFDITLMSTYDYITLTGYGDLNDIFTVGNEFVVSGNLYSTNNTTWTVESTSYSDPVFTINTVAHIQGTQPGGSIAVEEPVTSGPIGLIASADIFNAGHVGSIWMISQKRDDQILKGSLSSDGNSVESGSFTGSYSFTTSGTWDGTVTLERKATNTNVWVPALSSLTSTNFDNPAETESDGAVYRVKMENLVAGGVCDFTFTIQDPLNHGIVRITNFTDANEVAADIISPLGNTDPTTQWKEGYWSDYRGWPKTVEFHQQRLVFGGSKTFPQTIWFGKANPDDYENFTEGTLDTSSFPAALPGQNPIQWLLSQDYLFIGTSGSVGKYGDQGKAITPTSPNYREQSKSGSADIKAVLAGDALLYVERGGAKVRELIYSLAMDKYQSPDLSILAEDIARSGIKDVAFQSRPDQMLWCVLNDGNMAVLTYQKDQEVIGWTLHDTDGTFESVCRIPGQVGTSEDEIWVLVKRNTGTGIYGDGVYGSGVYGSAYFSVEQFQPRHWGSDVNDCWFVDSGLSYTGTATTNFSGLEYLTGKTVSVYADGMIQSDEIVDANGEVTIDRAASNVTIGLPFTAKLETLPLRVDPQDAAMNKKIREINIDFWETGSCKYGNGSNSELTTINFMNDVGADPNAVFQELYSSIVSPKRLTWPYGSMKKQTVYIESDDPMPMTIRGIGTNYDIVP